MIFQLILNDFKMVDYVTVRSLYYRRMGPSMLEALKKYA